MNNTLKKLKTPIHINIALLLSIILILLASILTLNDGLLVYVLDDTYIHLALAENIKQGHYGVNLNEVSSPSSSILWPFILAPFSSYVYSPFVINVGAAIINVILFIKILDVSTDITNNRIRNIIFSIFTAMFIVATNVISLVFVGMEHSMQVMFVLMIIYGLIIEIEKGEVKWWLLVAIIMAPLIRYDTTAVSLAAIMYLLIRGYFKPVALTVVPLILLVGGFAIFLRSLGLDLIPDSIIMKGVVGAISIAHEESTSIQTIINTLIENLIYSLDYRQSVIMSIGLLMLVYYVFSVNEVKRKQLAVVAIVATLVHFVAGGWGWYHRYEIYILTFEFVIILYLFWPFIAKYLFASNRINYNLIIVFFGVIAISSASYLYSTVNIPLASNNIYENHYQLHRFVVDYYKKPVAVNDLGYVSYKNDNYILDVLGLGSHAVVEHRRNADNPEEWIKNLLEKDNVELIMSFPFWLDEFSGKWIKVGELHLGKKAFIVPSSRVDFYAINQKAYEEIVEQLTRFKETLPDGVEFIFEKDIIK